MPYPRSIENGAGETLTFLGVVQAPGGARLEADGTATPGAGPPMHVHYLQEEAARGVAGRMGYQVLGEAPKIAEAGELVVWPAGTPHKWWNAGSTELRMSGWCRPPGNVEYFLTQVFASMARHGGRRPGLLDAAFLMTRYRSEFAMLDLPVLLRRVLIPVVYRIGRALGAHRKFEDAPPPVAPRASAST